MKFGSLALLLFIATVLAAPGALAQAPPPQQSTISSAVRPAGTPVALADPAKMEGDVIVPGVPAYIWRHGCGPTAVGMVLGYWDGAGMSDLFFGDASTPNNIVYFCIASSMDLAPETFVPLPYDYAHYEDYAQPIDYLPNLLQDAYATAGRQAHADHCLADFMLTSRSDQGNYYGWSWSNHISPAFSTYVTTVSENYTPSVTEYYMPPYTPTLTFNILKNEIDNNRPMVFLVDSDGDGFTDHFVTVVGYNELNPADPQYLFHDTWDSNVHSATFQGTAAGADWGVWGACAFSIVDVTPPAELAATITGAGWQAVGDRMELNATVSGALGNVQYQWEMGTTEQTMSDLAGATSATYLVEAVSEGHEGWYRCRVNDEAKAVSYTPAVHVEVFEALPATELAAILAGGLALAAAGAWRIRRRKNG